MVERYDSLVMGATSSDRTPATSSTRPSSRWSPAATYSAVGNAIHIHPTLAEGMNSAAGGVHRPWTKD